MCIVPLTCSYTPNLELLTIKCHPFFLPWELTSVIVSAIYIPLQADTDPVRLITMILHSLCLGILKGPASNTQCQNSNITCPTRSKRIIDHSNKPFKDSYLAQSHHLFGKCHPHHAQIQTKAETGNAGSKGGHALDRSIGGNFAGCYR